MAAAAAARAGADAAAAGDGASNGSVVLAVAAAAPSRPSRPLDLARLPTDMALLVLQFLDGRDLAHGEQVSRRWRELCMTPRLWYRVAAPLFPRGTVTFENARIMYGLRVASINELRREELRAVEEEAARRAAEQRRRRVESVLEVVEECDAPSSLALLWLLMLVQLILLPFKLQGTVDWPWMGVLAPLHLFNIILLSQLLSCALRKALPDLRHRNASSFVHFVVEAGDDRAWLQWLLFAANCVWPAFIAALYARLVDADADAESDISWTLLAVLFAVPTMAFAYAIAKFVHGALDDDTEPSTVHIGCLALQLAAICCAAILSGVNADHIASHGEEKMSWASALLPLWMVTALQVLPLYACVSRQGDWSALLLHVFLSGGICVFALPSALLAARLEGARDFSFFEIFAPWFALWGAGSLIFCLLIAAMSGDDD